MTTLEQPDTLPVQPQPGDLIGHVGIQRRRNKDRSITVYLRWREHTTRPKHKDFTQRFARTGPGATKHEVRQIIAQARLRAKEIEDWMRDGRPVRKDGRRYFLRPAVANYLDWLHPTASTSTYDRRETRLLHLMKWFSEAHPKLACVHQMTVSKVQQYLDACRTSRCKPLKYSTLRLLRSDLRHFFTFCMEHLWTSINPADGVNLPRAERPESKYALPLKNVHRILSDDKCNHVVRFMFGTGLRPCEVETIRWRHCNTADGLLMVPRWRIETNKGHGRVIPIGRDLVRLLREWRDGCALEDLAFPDGHKRVARFLRKHRHVVMDRHVVPYDCRFWYNTTLKSQSCPKEMRQMLMGHLASGSLHYYEDDTVALDLDRARGFVEAVDEMLKVQKAPGPPRA